MNCKNRGSASVLFHSDEFLRLQTPGSLAEQSGKCHGRQIAKGDRVGGEMDILSEQIYFPRLPNVKLLSEIEGV